MTLEQQGSRANTALLLMVLMIPRLVEVERCKCTTCKAVSFWKKRLGSGLTSVEALVLGFRLLRKALLEKIMMGLGLVMIFFSVGLSGLWKTGQFTWTTVTI